MARPFRHYCFTLARSMGMSVKRLLLEFSSAEISEWMAYDALENKDFRDELEMKSRTPDENSALLKKLLTGEK